MKTNIKNNELKKIKTQINKIDKELEDQSKKIEKIDSNVRLIAKTVFSDKFVGTGRILQCSKCNYVWKSKTKKDTISCPNCRRIGNTEDMIIKDMDDEKGGRKTIVRK